MPVGCAGSHQLLYPPSSSCFLPDPGRSGIQPCSAQIPCCTSLPQGVWMPVWACTGVWAHCMLFPLLNQPTHAKNPGARLPRDVLQPKTHQGSPSQISLLGGGRSRTGRSSPSPSAPPQNPPLPPQRAIWAFQHGDAPRHRVLVSAGREPGGTAGTGWALKAGRAKPFFWGKSTRSGGCRPAMGRGRTAVL